MKEYKPSYYAIVPSEIRYDNNLSDSEKLLYAEITALTNSHGYCWSTNAYFAKLYGVTERTISRRINNLKEKGYIDVELVRDKKSDKTLRKIKIVGRQNCLGGVDNSVHRGVDKNVYHNNTSNKNNTSNNNNPYNPLKEMFDQFWSVYPKKRNKGQAKRAFKKNVKDEETLQLILKDLERRKHFYDWIKQDGQFIPYPSTYLNAHAWLDEYETGTPKPQIKKQQHIKHHVSMPDYSKNAEIDEDVDQLKAELEEMLKGE